MNWYDFSAKFTAKMCFPIRKQNKDVGETSTEEETIGEYELVINSRLLMHLHYILL